MFAGLLNHQSLLVGLLTVATAAGIAAQPETRPADIGPNSAAAPTTQPQPRPAADLVTGGALPAARGALLREGGYLLQTNGTVYRHQPTGWWRFRIARDDPRKPLYELTILPCTLLANMRQIVESTHGEPRQEIVFELTGQVFVYRGRNYLLPTHAPLLVGYEQPATAVSLGEAEAESSGAETAQEILRDLEQAVGPVAQAPSGARREATAVEPGRQPLLPPGTAILWRRGRMVREAGGAWSLVFDADGEGLADPPMILLPCLLLERMERYAQRTATHRPLLISGRVYRYHGRNYLLPTSFQIPRERTALRP